MNFDVTVINGAVKMSKINHLLSDKVHRLQSDAISLQKTQVSTKIFHSIPEMKSVCTI